MHHSPFVLKHRHLMVVVLFSTCVLGAPRSGVRCWFSNRAIPLQPVDTPRSAVNTRWWPRSKSLSFDTPKTTDFEKPITTSQTSNRVERKVKSIICTLKEWREKVGEELFFSKDGRNTRYSKSKEEPIRRRQRCIACISSGVQHLWGGMLHVLRNYGLIWALESIGTEIVHTPVKLFLYHGSERCPSIYRQFRKGLVAFSLHFDWLTTSVEGILLLLYPLLLCQRFVLPVHKDQDTQSALTSSISMDSRLAEAVFVAPIYEEFVYRFLFRKVWMGLMHVRKWVIVKFMRKHAGDQATDTKQEGCGDLNESWIFPSSFLFGMAHVSNWMPLDRKYLWDKIFIFLRLVDKEDLHRYPMRRRSEQNLLHSVYQQQHALVLSLICFAPVYRHLGMMGSIGSHAMLNLIACSFPNQRYILALFSILLRGFTRTSSSTQS